MKNVKSSPNHSIILLTKEQAQQVSGGVDNPDLRLFTVDNPDILVSKAMKIQPLATKF